MIVWCVKKKNRKPDALDIAKKMRKKGIKEVIPNPNQQHTPGIDQAPVVTPVIIDSQGYPNMNRGQVLIGKIKISNTFRSKHRLNYPRKPKP